MGGGGGRGPEVASPVGVAVRRFSKFAGFSEIFQIFGLANFEICPLPFFCFRVEENFFAVLPHEAIFQVNQLPFFVFELRLQVEEAVFALFPKSDFSYLPVLLFLTVFNRLLFLSCIYK